MAVGRNGARRPLVGAGFSRRDFLKMGGAGLAGATLLGTAGCESIFGGGDAAKRPLHFRFAQSFR